MSSVTLPAESSSRLGSAGVTGKMRTMGPAIISRTWLCEEDDMEHEPAAQDRAEPEVSRPQAPPSYPFGKNLAPMLPWSHVVERLEGARYYWLATTRPDGRPHVTPLWGVWIDEALYLDGP